MTAVYPPPVRSTIGARLFALAADRPVAIAVFVTLFLTILRCSGTVDSDVAWQLWIAGRIHDGANLYTDIIETNPPLWFWMALPIERLSVLLHVRIEAVLIASMGGASALALVATNRLTTHIAPARRVLLLAGGAVALMAVPWVHVGQREQIVLIGTCAYAALIAARQRGERIPAVLGALVGVGAGIAFALKHYFLLVPALLELWLVAANWRHWRPVRPETIAIALVGCAYAAAIVTFEPDFLSRIVPLLGLAYGGFGAPSLAYLFGRSAVVGGALLIALGFQWRLLASGKAPFATAMTIATLAFAAIYFIQFKGWPYHAIPVLGCGCLALAALIAEADAPPLSVALFAPALLLLSLSVTANEAIHPPLPSADLTDALAGTKRGDVIGFIATETAVPWSVTLQRGYRYPSRYNGYWMLPAIIDDEAAGGRNPAMKVLGRQIVSETVADFACTPPERIIVARPHPGDPAFDILPFFERDPNFRALMSHYRVRSRTSVEAFDRVSPLSPPTTPCRKGV